MREGAQPAADRLRATERGASRPAGMPAGPVGLRAIVLGAAAGGGYPQWNCCCGVCALAWDGDPRVKPRTQSSLAISADGREWVLLNASPDLGAQIRATPPLHPRRCAGGGRDSPIRAVVLTNGDVDHVAGLLTLREKAPLTVFATAEIRAAVAANPLFGVLDPALVAWREIALGRPFAPLPGLPVEAFAVPGKVPLYLEGDVVEIGAETGSTIGVSVRAAGARLDYVPGCAAVTSALAARLAGTDALLFDGTVFHDDEMLRAGVGTKTGRRMGHLPVGGADGSLAALAPVAAGRKVFVHINNTNPMLVDGSPERRAVDAAGWTVAEDGTEIALPVRGAGEDTAWPSPPDTPTATPTAKTPAAKTPATAHPAPVSSPSTTIAR
jgi:pyrroloquinoline quinone biosynthesis protein B